MNRSVCSRLLVLVVLSCADVALFAREATEPDAWDSAWNRAVLYTADGDDPFVRHLTLSGRLQAEYASFDGRENEDWDDLLWRRFRFGGKLGLGGHWTLHAEGDFNLNRSPGDWFSRMTDAYVGFKRGRAVDLKILKHSAGFTLDGATSSTRLLTLQRNNLSNNLWFNEEYFIGASVKGESDSGLLYRAGVYSNDPGDNLKQLGDENFFLGSLGQSFAHSLNLESAELRLDIVVNQEHPDAQTAPFTEVASLVSQWQGARWGLRTDLSTGRGFAGQPDVWGFVLMPIYNHGPRWQWLARYTYIDSDGRNGLVLGRYEREVVGGRGDRYNELYGGVNYFFYGHRLKWQLGVQYTRMDDAGDDGGEHRGWGLTTGLRMFW